MADGVWKEKNDENIGTMSLQAVDHPNANRLESLTHVPILIKKSRI